MSTIRVRRLDSNHDPMFGRGQDDYLTDLDAMVQIINTSLLLFKGEWFEDQGAGLPMWQSILGVTGIKNPERAIAALIVKYIAAIQYVTSVTNVVSKYDPSKRTYSFSATVNTQFGKVTLSNS